MERDWIPPEPHGVERVGSDEDLAERRTAHEDFEGEFGEREAARGDFEGEFGERAARGQVEREAPEDAPPH